MRSERHAALVVESQKGNLRHHTLPPSSLRTQTSLFAASHPALPHAPLRSTPPFRCCLTLTLTPTPTPTPTPTLTPTLNPNRRCRTLYDAGMLVEAKSVLKKAAHAKPGDARLLFNAAYMMQVRLGVQLCVCVVHMCSCVCAQLCGHARFESNTL